MKKILFTLFLAAIASTGIAQDQNYKDIQQDVQDLLLATNSQLVSVDTVYLPIYKLLTLRYKLGNNRKHAEDGYASWTKRTDYLTFLRQLRQLCYDISEEATTELLSIAAALYDPQPATGDGKDYQRVIIRTPEGKEYSVYTKVGKDKVDETASWEKSEIYSECHNHILAIKDVVAKIDKLLP